MALPETNEDGKILSDAWDYKHRPAIKSETGGWSSAAKILGVELWERMTTLGIAVNLVTYLTGTMHLGNAQSANTVTNFLGTSFMLCLLGGFVADTFLGRPKMAMSDSPSHFPGVQLPDDRHLCNRPSNGKNNHLTISKAQGVTILTTSTVVPSLKPPACARNSPSCVPANGLQLGVLYLALYLTALGTGGLKSSVSGFGSDQFDESTPRELKQMSAFFNWFFFFINIGSLAAVTVLVYIQDNLGRRWGYGICAVAILFGVVVFLSGTRRYRFKKLVGSPLTQIASVVVAACRKRQLELPSDPNSLYDVDETEEKAGKKKAKLPHSKQFRPLLDLCGQRCVFLVESMRPSGWVFEVRMDDGYRETITIDDWDGRVGFGAFSDQERGGV
ncbi:hypothetical protein ACLOJK_033391 [Asimina triloba]